MDEKRAQESERVNGILRRLASQIRGERVPPHAAGKPNDAPAMGEGKGPAASTLPSAGLPDARTDISLDSAVEALRSTVASMRASGAATPAAPPSQVEMRLAAVADALAKERVEVCLEPILALADDRASHFEVTVRLKSPTGEMIDAREALEKASSAQASGAGLLPVLDALGLRHSSGIALKLERRGRQGSVFSQVSGESLRDPRFVSDVAGRHAQGIADRMVLTFAQDEVQGLGPAQHSVLGSLSQLGFRFSLRDVAHLDMDFEELRPLGFEFVKLDAEMFLKGLTLGNATVPPTDLCRFFADQGLSIIVGQIEDEWVRARILGFGVVFGQGTLFGGPRPIQVGASPAQGSQVVA
ncbi:MAG: EAL domain-containing protein [Hyphomicrobiaceae bacterium]